jgi:hypothetical protein
LGGGDTESTAPFNRNFHVAGQRAFFLGIELQTPVSRLF